MIGARSLAPLVKTRVFGMTTFRVSRHIRKLYRWRSYYAFTFKHQAQRRRIWDLFSEAFSGAFEGREKNAAIGANKSIEKKNFKKAIRGQLGVQ